MVLPKDPKLCWAGRLHPVPYNKWSEGYFAVAIAELHYDSTVYLTVGPTYACKDHLDSLLDFADNHPEREPEKIEWLI